MRTMLLIAGNTFRETLRNKILYNVLLFAAVVIVLSVSFGEWSVFSRVQVMQDFGLATMSISGLLLAVFIGVGLLGREISTKTVYMLATKPVDRAALIAGKFLGLVSTLFLNFGIMTVLFLGVLWFIEGVLDFRMLPAVLLIWIEMALIIAVSVFFSTLTSPTLAALFTIGFYIAGHFNDMVDVVMVQDQHVWLASLLKVLYFVLPNLEHFNIRSRVVYGLSLPDGFLAMAVAYGILYIGVFIVLSCAVFDKRDL